MDIPEPDVCLPQLYQQFIRALVERFQPERRLGRLKEYTHYFARNYFFGHHLASKVQASSSLEEAWIRAVEFFGENDPGSASGLESPFDATVRGAAADCSNQNQASETSLSAVLTSF
jgi:hypothetical protein